MANARWKGFSKENLARGFWAALGLTAITLLLAGPLCRGSCMVSTGLAVLAAWFAALTLAHALVHLAFSLLHDAGMAAAQAGEHERAVRRLGWFAVAGFHHYDESGDAHRALLACLLHLGRDAEARRVLQRCERLGIDPELEAKD